MLGVKVVNEENPKPIFSNKCSLTKYPEKIIPGMPYSWFCEGKSLKALIYKDSFFVTLEPYFRLKFGKSTYIPKRASYDSVVEQITDDKPDVLIEEWVERKLPRAYSGRYSLEQDFEYKAVLDDSISQKPAPYFANTKVLYNLGDGGLDYHQFEVTGVKGESLQLMATGGNPIIYFPDLDMRNGVKYTLHVTFSSDVKSDLRLFYSTSEEKKFPFSNEHSIRKSVNIGRNEIYIEFAHPRIGKRLRLDVISKVGAVEISKLELRQH